MQREVNKPAVAHVIPHPTALSLLAQYSSSEDEEDVDESIYRKPASSSSSSSSSSDEELDIKVIEKKIREPVESDGDSDDENTNKKKKREPLKVKGELSMDDLPPIQDLQITVDGRECMEIGCITTIVDQLGELNNKRVTNVASSFLLSVLVEALRNSVPLDIDSVLFLNHGEKALGKVFDVIGPVYMPIYCVRFNSHEEILAKGIAVGDKIFCAPRSEYTSFVMLSQMPRGSDASWKNDIEPPNNMVDYSDDEQERKTKRQAKANRAQNSGERREFVRGQRQLPTQNLAYPNYSWHQNLPSNSYQQQNYNQQ